MGEACSSNGADENARKRFVGKRKGNRTRERKA